MALNYTQITDLAGKREFLDVLTVALTYRAWYALEISQDATERAVAARIFANPERYATQLAVPVIKGGGIDTQSPTDAQVQAAVDSQWQKFVLAGV